jgi:hypothetical protein
MKTRRGALPRSAGAVRCSECGATARADGKGTPIILQHEAYCSERFKGPTVTVEKDDDPWLEDG